jgi:small neutral amino acid transporter SnatA (MarC family)
MHIFSPPGFTPLGFLFGGRMIKQFMDWMESQDQDVRDLIFAIAALAMAVIVMVAMASSEAIL